MKIKKITAVSFSPTGGTRRSTNLVSDWIAAALGCAVQEEDITGRANRQRIYRFSKNELLVIGMPVYAGRLPNKIAPDLAQMLRGEETPAVLVVSYGNRSAGDAVTELQQILERNGFCPLAAGAVATKHAFSDKIAADRPDDADKEQIRVWCGDIVRKLTGETVAPLPSVGDRVLAPYYTPLTEEGRPAVFLKAKPKTDPVLCDGCGLCAAVCPMSSISAEDCSCVSGICIKCQACVRGCPRGAKYFDDRQFLSHVAMLEKNYTAKAENTYLV